MHFRNVYFDVIEYLSKTFFFPSESGGELDEDMDSDGGSVSLDDEDDASGSDLFEDDDDDDDNGDEEMIDGDSDAEISDPDEPKAKKSKAFSSKEFQRKLKNTDSTCFDRTTIRNEKMKYGK